MKNGWISIHRKIQDKKWWYKQKFTLGQAWIDLLLMANHKDNNTLIGWKTVKVKRGSLLTSQKKLAKRWKWSRHKTNNFLNFLKRDTMADFKTDTKYTLINVINYNKYQDTDKIRTSKGTPKRTSTGHQRDTNNNVTIMYNNDINNKVIKYSPESLKLAKFLYELIKQENPNWYVKPNWDTWAEDIDKIHRIDGRTYEQIEWMIKWVQQDDFWKTNILSPAKLRKQFNQLVIRAKAKQPKVAIIR